MSHFPNDDFIRKLIDEHFRRRKVVLDEDEMLRAIASPRSKRDVYWAVLALRDCGTARCIPALKDLLHYPMQDVKDCSLLTIAHIAGAAETPFYMAALADKKTRKGYPMWAIQVAADERAVPDVLAFVDTALRKASRSTAASPDDAYVYGCRFLARIGVAPDALAAILTKLRSVWAQLPSDHRRSLRAAFPAAGLPA
jgi:hypothetical protein